MNSSALSLKTAKPGPRKRSPPGNDQLANSYEFHLGVLLGCFVLVGIIRPSEYHIT